MKSRKGESRETAGRRRGAGGGDRPPAQPRRFEAHAPGERPDDGNAFFPDPGGGPARAPEDLSESLAEELVQSATTGEDAAEDELDATVPEEIGGPFTETRAEEELAAGVDEANPPGSRREPLPRPVAGLVEEPTVDEHLDGSEPADATDAAEPESPDPAPGVAALNDTTRGGRRTS